MLRDLCREQLTIGKAHQTMKKKQYRKKDMLLINAQRQTKIPDIS